MPRQRANGEGSIIKLANGKYKAIFTLSVEYNPDCSVRKQPKKTFTHEKRGECQKWLTEMINQKNKNTLIKPNKTSVIYWLNNWLENYVKPSKKPRTYGGYKCIIENYLKPNLGNKTLQGLKTTDLQEIFNKLLASGKSTRTVEYTYTTIKAALEQAFRERLIYRNVAKDCRVKRVEKVKNTLQVLDESRVKILLEANKEDLYYPILVLVLNTGLRASEIAALYWKNINLPNKTLCVTHDVVNASGELIYQEPKSSSSIRNIPLPSKAVEVMREYYDRCNFKDEDLVFPSSKGTFTQPSVLTHYCYRWFKNAKLPRLSFHSLRHTHATLLLKNGVDVKTVSTRLGHSTIQLTLNTYIHVLPQMKQNAVDILDNIC